MQQQTEKPVAWLDFNINDEVRIKLTDYGRSCLAENAALLSMQARMKISTPRYMEDANGWSNWQLWHLFEEFGEHIHQGGPLPFETNISFSTSCATDERIAKLLEAVCDVLSFNWGGTLGDEVLESLRVAYVPLSGLIEMKETK